MNFHLCIRTSDETEDYNCIAWAAEEDTRFWWPVVGYYWPDGLPLKITLDNFINAYKKLGYEVCLNEQLEPQYKKIALYVRQDGVPSHASLQLPNGKWTSKLGRSFDVEHDFIKVWGEMRDVTGQYTFILTEYGKLAVLLRKRI